MVSSDELIQKATNAEECEKAIFNLEKKLHRNHLLILEVKNKLLVMYSQLSSNSRVIMDRQIQLGLEILQVKKEYLNLVRKQFNYMTRKGVLVFHIDVPYLQVLAVIDPGVTTRRGNLLRLLLGPWVTTARSDYNKGIISNAQFKGKAKKSLDMMREMVQCLKHDNPQILHGASVS